jgi:endonuclease/exonuclease/phosphatase (EEP) superfamily protein YafD
MKSKTNMSPLLLVLILATGFAMADESSAVDTGFRVLSWNISDDAFVSNQAGFLSLLQRARPDILLLDEVSPAADIGLLQLALGGLASEPDKAWHIDVSKSGGRQRCVIASQAPQEALPEFSSIVPYTENDRQRILQSMSPADRENTLYSMDAGIPVNGAVILMGDRRLLVVITDLQCCGDDPGSWQELRRRSEAAEIRRRVRQVLDRTTIDGIIVAGDFNLVSTSLPLVIMTGPFEPPHSGLIAAELYHLNGSVSWTWDGRGTPFPSRALDFQLYSPQALGVRNGYILDSEDLTSAELEQTGLRQDTSIQLSNHRPLVVEYTWVAANLGSVNLGSE